MALGRPNRRGICTVLGSLAAYGKGCIARTLVERSWPRVPGQGREAEGCYTTCRGVQSDGSLQAGSGLRHRYLQWAGNPTNRVPVCGETGQWGDVRIACQPRGLWRRSGHSTRMLRVMPQTGGRAAGLWRCPRLCGGGRGPSGDKQSRQTKHQVWRAVCAETCKHGSEGDGWKRAVR
jgi:hypothetical protein